MFKTIRTVTNKIRRYRDANVYIYQMGKVGSTSLEESIDGAVHMHTLYGNSECYVRKKQIDSDKSWLYRLFRKLFEFVIRCVIRNKERVKVISMVRLPTDRNVSMFFQHLPYWYCDYLNNNNDGKISRESGNQIIYNSFNIAFDHDYALNWLNEELVRFTGIDFYTSMFPVEQGYELYEKDNFSVLLIRMDKIDECYSKGVISTFLGQDFEMKRSNESEDKWYSEVLNKFRSEYVFPADLMDRLLTSKLSTHFYKQAEIEKNRIKWSK
ncbi:putative capsular polysaccharide synthesis family protein [Vibrio astriarenae]